MAATETKTLIDSDLKELFSLHLFPPFWLILSLRGYWIPPLSREKRSFCSPIGGWHRGHEIISSEYIGTSQNFPHRRQEHPRIASLVSSIFSTSSLMMILYHIFCVLSSPFLKIFQKSQKFFLLGGFSPDGYGKKHQKRYFRRSRIAQVRRQGQYPALLLPASPRAKKEGLR